MPPAHSSWSQEVMYELRALTASRRARGETAPSLLDLDWVDRVLRRVGLPHLPTPIACLSFPGHTAAELIWPDPRVRVLLAPPLGLAGWPTYFAARRLKRKLRRPRNDA